MVLHLASWSLLEVPAFLLDCDCLFRCGGHLYLVLRLAGFVQVISGRALIIFLRSLFTERRIEAGMQESAAEETVLVDDVRVTVPTITTALGIADTAESRLVVRPALPPLGCSFVSDRTGDGIASGVLRV